MEIQRLLGSDIVLAFHECPALPPTDAAVAASMTPASPMPISWADSMFQILARAIDNSAVTRVFRSIASFSLALPTTARCDRPKGASASMSSENPGILAQGPEEKRAFAGRTAGFVTAVILSFQICALRWGRVSRRHA